ncbi:hypothetical protein KCP75_07545 [Salmonella enterica subsp. enterica]|nr:hypothetical protein KCP75_07545 [Salmonella enterica subsp. enterica]
MAERAGESPRVTAALLRLRQQNHEPSVLATICTAGLLVSVPTRSSLPYQSRHDDALTSCCARSSP